MSDTQLHDQKAQAGQDAAHWIQALGLEAHPEGGYFREVFRSPETLPTDALPDRYEGERSASTSIYFLVTADAPSR
ncbi:MAG: cupin domain-containing protein, partial [Bacteroidota bacterium]